jgi:hypothetical protein
MTTRAFFLRTVTIPADADGLMDAGIDTEGYLLQAIYMPADWTAGDLTFQAATTLDGTYYNVYDDADAEVKVEVAEDRVVVLGTITKNFAGIKFLKLRSGTSGSPVQQGAIRTLTLAFRPFV